MWLGAIAAVFTILLAFGVFGPQEVVIDDDQFDLLQDDIYEIPIQDNASIDITEVNVYEYTEFMWAGEADDLGLEGGIGNYFKYYGDYEIHIDDISISTVNEIRITITGYRGNEPYKEFYHTSITTIETLDLIGDFPKTSFDDYDCEEARVFVSVTYTNNDNQLVTINEVMVVNVDEDIF